ncbi:hypothetical protein N7470_001042 [Penicillium chermesinum]|nr:hypothetical protein N7470_001042 [Penicillium chermesinum]
MDYHGSTSVFRALPNEDARRGTKRNRQTISCTRCRARKIKCDRQNPCISCIRRGHPEECEFSKHRRRKVSDGSLETASQKLERLEKLAYSMAGCSEPSTSANIGIPPPAPEERDINSFTKLVGAPPTPFSPASHTKNDDLSKYLGATHWKELIQRIKKVEDSLGLGVSQAPEPEWEEMNSEGPSMILTAQVKPLSLRGALDVLPSWQTTERLLAIYFSKKLMAAPYIHTIKFERELKALSSEPSSTSFLWLSILFSILFIAWKTTSDGSNVPDLLSSDRHPSQFLKRAAQCLISGDYLKIQPYSIESLLMYCSACTMQTGDVNPGIWSLFSLATRQAQRMGYHRDPRRLSRTMSPFDAEMRRRVWYWIEGCDVLYSYQLGMPCIIHEDECDTDMPSSVDDEALSEDCPILPATVPGVLPGKMEFYHHKAAQTRLFRRVTRLVLSTGPPDHDAIQQVDRDLRTLRQNVPNNLKWRPITSTNFSDPSYVIMFRVMIEQFHLRCVCILHRIYLTFQRENPQYDLQRAVCVAAAMELLDQQACVESERQPFGRLQHEDYMLAGLTKHTFLFAAMVICLELSLSSPTTTNASDRQAKIRALEISHHIYSSSKDARDHGHAANVLGAILAQTKRRESPNRVISAKHETEMPGSSISAHTSLLMNNPPII